MYDFDRIIDRRNTGSLKWDRYAADILPMWVADMDFRSPEPVIEALQARAAHGVFGYTEAYDSVVQAVVETCASKWNWQIDPDWLVWAPGVVPMLNVAGRMLEPGEAVLVTTPIYPPFLNMPAVADRARITVPMVWDTGMSQRTFDWDALEAAVTPATRMFMLCSPYNPLGRVFTDAELERVIDFCVRHDLLILSDEIHCELILDADLRHKPTATLSDAIADRVMTFMAPSKTYNVPGLGCAFGVIADAKLRARFKRAMRGNISEVTAMGFTGCEAAFRHGEPWRLALIDYLRENRDLVQATIAETPGVSTTHVQATYLQWLDLRELGLDDPADHFNRHGLGLSPSLPFGCHGHLRLNFGCPRATLRDGLARLQAAVAAI